MMDQHAFRCLFKRLGSQFFFQEAYLCLTQGGEIIQAIINPMVIGFIFTAIQHDDTSIAPVKRTVCLIADIIEQFTQTDRISIPDLMVTTQIKYRNIRSPDRFIQFRKKMSCFIMIGGIVDTIAVKDNEIIIYTFYLII